jgi:Transposase IS66 family
VAALHMIEPRAERLHGDDTTVPVLAKGKTYTGRVWVYCERRQTLPTINLTSSFTLFSIIKGLILTDFLIAIV